MIDTITIKKINPSTDELKAVLNNLNLEAHYEEKGYCNTRLRNLKIYINNNQTIQISGSLPEYFYGDNSITLNFSTIKETISSIEKELGISLLDAFIHRIDLSSNVSTTHKPSAYFSYLVNKPYFERFLKKTSLYFSTNSETVNIYEKRRKNSTAFNKKLMRYEHRLKNLTIIKTKLKIDKVHSIVTREIYDRLVKYWYQSYLSIQKINLSLVIGNINSEKSFKDFISYSGIEHLGGLTEVISLIDQLRLEDYINRTTACNIKASIKHTGKKLNNDDGGLIKELDFLFEKEYQALLLQEYEGN